MGRAIALDLARRGADCVVTYRRNETLARDVTAAIEGLGRRALALHVDLADPPAVGRALERVGEAFGRLDILVANAAATAFRPVLEQKEHNIRKTFAISVDSLVAAVQGAVPLMRGRPGRVVVISGIDSHQAMAGHGVLGAAKAAAESLVRGLALELGPLGITVNGVSPGIIDTDSSRMYFGQALGRDFAEAAAEIARATPVRRLGTVDDVAALVGFIVSDDASFLTGQTILLDGGLCSISPVARVVREI
jgi:enoyl-[acyl-carrier protein] reductase III